MKITASSLQLSASHSLSQHHELTERLDSWSRPEPARPIPREASRADTVQLSDMGKAAVEAERLDGKAAEEAIDNDPRLTLIRSLLELLTGRAMKVFDTREMEAPPCETPVIDAPESGSPPNRPSGWGMRYERHESYTESEHTEFSATGTVTTSDGREISFSVQLSMARAFHRESNIEVRLGDAARKIDPLVLNFSGTAAQLENQRFAFDLNADGQTEQINFVSPGSGFLVFDRNQDGRINDGTELFGPTSNNGFQELSALDNDRNGWIDENDPAFVKLQVWTRDTEGKDELRGLAESGIGAIGLAHVATPFALKDTANRTLGEICSSGIVLLETGVTGTIQQIDLTA